MEVKLMNSAESSSSYSTCREEPSLASAIVSTNSDTSQLTNPSSLSLSYNSTAALLAAPIHLEDTRFLAAASIQKNLIGGTGVGRMTYGRNEDVAMTESPMDAPATDKTTKNITDKATMGVVSAINSMNASMNATRLSSIALASALETYAAVIENSPPPTYSSRASPPETSRKEAHSMCFTHAAVVWMEWATIQANLQLSLMQDLFKMKSLAELSEERNSGADIDIEAHEFDALEADSIRNIVAKLTRLSHESFKEAYEKGADWNGAGGLDYWVARGQADQHDVTIPYSVPPMAAFNNSNTQPRSVTDTAGSEAAIGVTRVERERVSLRRKRGGEDLRGRQASDNDSNSAHSKRFRPEEEPGTLSSTLYSPRDSSGIDSLDGYSDNIIANPIQEGSGLRGQQVFNHEQDKEGRFYNYPGDNTSSSPTPKGVCPTECNKGPGVIYEDADWQAINYNGDDATISGNHISGSLSFIPSTSLSDDIDISAIELYSPHVLPYAITEEGTIKSTPPRAAKVDVRSIFFSTPPKCGNYSGEVKHVPAQPHIRRKGKFEKKNGSLQILRAGENLWRSAGSRSPLGELLTRGESVGGGQNRFGAINFKTGNPHKNSMPWYNGCLKTHTNSFAHETAVNVGNTAGLPKYSELGYFSEDLVRKEAALEVKSPSLDKEHSSSRWNRLSRVKEIPLPAPAREMVKYIPLGESTLSNLKGKMKYNCFGGDEMDSE